MPDRPDMSAKAPEAVVVGALMWDVLGRASGVAARGADLPGRVLRRPGGVAANVACGIAAAGVRAALVAAVGTDPAGAALLATCRARGVDVGRVLRLEGAATDCYAALEDDAGLVGAVADTALLDAAGARLLAPLRAGRLGAAVAGGATLVLDGNLPGPALAEAAALDAADLRLVAASPAKAARLMSFRGCPRATLYVNLAEARALLAASRPGEPATAAEAAAALVAAGFARAIVTEGARGVAEAGARGSRRRAPAACAAPLVTGAGDALVAAHVAAERRGAGAEEALAAAVAAAAAHLARSLGAQPA